MRLLKNLTILLFNKFVLRKSTGECVKQFATSMGTVYIKLAQILATQDAGNLFTDRDRRMLISICDDVNPVAFSVIQQSLYATYGEDLKNIFKRIMICPVGSASVSQVHRATLTTGEEVVIKVKRADIEEQVNHDIAVLRMIVRIFGKLFGIKNKLCGSHSLSLYLKWITEELDFEREAQNIEDYANFANSVNGKVANTVDIVVPKLYKSLCRKDVIVMEYIPYKTVSKLNLSDDTVKTSIVHAVNSYIQLSFYALFNSMPIYFHGDPHFGNIYLDDKGNIGFIDMGLLFHLDSKNSELTKEFFFCAFLGKSEHLYNMLLSYLSDDNNSVRNALKSDVEEYCKTIHRKVLTAYFMDMVYVCFKYNIDPPDFLFGMGKAFVYLSGADNVFDNEIIGYDLLKEQVTEFLLSQSMTSLKLTLDSVKAGIKHFIRCEDAKAIKYGADAVLSFVDIFKYLI